MERMLADGDYVPDGTGGLTALTGSGEVLARVLYRLTARRGALPFLPELGSRLYQLGREKPSARQALAAQYVTEALREETGWSRNTVLTYLTRMEAKGLVSVGEEGYPRLYRASVSREDCQAQARSDFLNRVYRGSAGDLVAAFLKEEPLSVTGRESLRRLLDEMEV